MITTLPLSVQVSIKVLNIVTLFQISVYWNQCKVMREKRKIYFEASGLFCVKDNRVQPLFDFEMKIDKIISLAS